MNRLPVLCLLGLMAMTPCTGNAAHRLPNAAEVLDAELQAILQRLADGQLPEARRLATQTAQRFPRSDLAQLLSAELTASAAQRQVLAGSDGAVNARLQDLLNEARARLHDRPAPADHATSRYLPDEVIQLGSSLSSLLVVDLEDSALHLLLIDNGVPNLHKRHYIGSGKAGYDKRIEGDNRTPLGIYRIDGHRTDESLPDLYGSGALTLDYPNILDRYLGRTGSGIWLHGVPPTQRSRAPRSSEGCVTMSNEHLSALHQHLYGAAGLPATEESSGSPMAESLVLLTHRLQWRPAADRRQAQERFQALFSRYQQAWHRRDDVELLALYDSSEQARKRLHGIATGQIPGMDQLDDVNRHDIGIYYSPSMNKPYADLPVLDSRGSDRHLLGRIGNRVTAEPTATRSTMPADTHVIMHVPVDPGLLTLVWTASTDGQWRLIAEQWQR